MTQNTLEQITKKNLQITTVTHADWAEHFITVQGLAGEQFDDLCAAFTEALAHTEALPVSIEVFGVPGEKTDVLEKALGARRCPATWLEGRRDRSSSIQGVQAWAISGVPTTPVQVDGQCVGLAFEADGLRYCRLGGLLPDSISSARDEQTRSLFALMEAALAEAGMSFADVVRTWFYNHNMLEWYDDFNAVRNAFFEARGVFDRLVPASTGIGACNARGAALTGGLLAVSGLESVRPEMVPSPLQCPSLEYGSAFSRAVEFQAGGMRRLHISGTASIAPEGESAHIGNVAAQVALTLDVVEAILLSRGMNWSDIARSAAYFTDVREAPALARCCAERGIPPFPVLLANTDICRDDLLFEMEADAIARI